jgi:hypothetical protein
MLVLPLTGNKKRPERAQETCAPVETLERITPRPPLGPFITSSGSTEFSLQYIQTRAGCQKPRLGFSPPRGPLSFHHGDFSNYPGKQMRHDGQVHLFSLLPRRSVWQIVDQI